MLRNLFVVLLMLGGLRLAFKSAFGALLFYLWIAYFRPESWVWNAGWVQALNLSLLVGVFVLVRCPTSGARFKMSAPQALMFLFLFQSLASVVMSQYFGYAWQFWVEFLKVIVISFILTSFVTDLDHLRQIVLTIACSVGFEAAKQGWLTMVFSPGSKNYNPYPIFGDENGVAVGMMMLTALFVALSQTTTKRWEKWLHRAFAFGVLYRGISTYSRGGFLSAGAMMLVYVARSKHKVRSTVAAAIAGAVIVSMMPQSFWDRMSTIKVKESEMEDSSASRIHFWRVATVMATQNPILGIGFRAYNKAFDQFDFSHGRFGTGRSVHSSWFGVLSELGIVGFAIYVLIILIAVVTLMGVSRRVKAGRAPPALGHYAIALQAAFAAFIVGGSFVPSQYMEMLWHMLALSVALGRLAHDPALAPATAEAPAAEPAPVVRPSYGGFQPGTVPRSA